MATKETGMYGMWSRAQKKFIFGIQESSKNKAKKALQKEIGRFDYWSFFPKAIKTGHDFMLGNGLDKELKVIDKED